MEFCKTPYIFLGVISDTSLPAQLPQDILAATPVMQADSISSEKFLYKCTPVFYSI